MDAAYLRENVFTALSEALVSMAVELPDDRVEYLGKYLINYVERKKNKEHSKSALQEILIRVNDEANGINTAEVQYHPFSDEYYFLIRGEEYLSVLF